MYKNEEMYKSYKFRIYPTTEQEVLFENNFLNDKKSDVNKHKSKYTKSYTTDGVLKKDHIKLLCKNKIRINQHRNIPTSGGYKKITILKTSTEKYFAIVRALISDEIKANSIIEVTETNSVGLDFSMQELYVSSDGIPSEYTKFLKQSLEKLKKEQHKLYNMQKGSNNREKQRLKVAKIHEKIANQRKDFLHKTSTQLLEKYDYIFIETLDIQEMISSNRFGENFNKSLYDTGWGMFTTFLDYKAKQMGKRIVKIKKYFASSKKCNNCGDINDNLELSDREWDCPNCKVHHNRDFNAAINIKKEGIWQVKNNY